MNPVAEIIRRFDALHLEVTVASCSDGSVVAILPNANIRAEHTVNSLHGYGEDANGALASLWQAVLDMDAGEWLLVRYGQECKRYYRWNGAAWKERDPEPDQVAA